MKRPLFLTGLMGQERTVDVIGLRLVPAINFRRINEKVDGLAKPFSVENALGQRGKVIITPTGALGQAWPDESGSSS